MLTSQTEVADRLLTLARTGIEALNREYASESSTPFHLLHRKRQWNAGEGVWMGWERKRGKLEEFNRLLFGATDTSYMLHVGDDRNFPSVRYVITLDADTILPREAAKRLVEVLAHPLNQARFDATTGRVTSGYTLIQPRVEVSPTHARRGATRLSRPPRGVEPVTLLPEHTSG